MNDLFRTAAALGLVAAAAACGSPRGDNTSTSYIYSDANDVDVDNVVDVSSETYPTRTYFYEPTDPAHVYWYESSAPDVWVYRPYYRDRGRTYFIERDGRSVRRVWFDDLRARDYDWSRDARWTRDRREHLRRAAREEWMRREQTERPWRNRWQEDHRDGDHDRDARRDGDRNDGRDHERDRR